MDSVDLRTAASWITTSNNVVAFTGAGISVESGIPDFRSPGGLWSKFDPATYCDFTIFQSKPQLFWEMSCEMLATVAAAQPNPAHISLAEMEKQKLISCIITQNIDNLHKVAGSTSVYELHGNAATSTCMACREQMPTPEAIWQLQGQSSKVPKCKFCDGVMKMDVILFGEPLTNSILEGAMAAAMVADVVLVVGTSLTVSPANMIVKFCKQRSGKVIIVDPDAHARHRGDLLLCGPAGVVMPQLLKACQAIRNKGEPQAKSPAAPLENVAEIKDDPAAIQASDNADHIVNTSV